MLKGTHGTSQSRAEEILQAKKFRSSQDGRAGPGVYFWEFVDSPVVACRLAREWWEFASKKDAYAADSNQECAVLTATIVASPEDVYLDLTDTSMHERLMALAIERGFQCREDLNKLVTLFVHMIETQLNKLIAILKVNVQSPAMPKKATTPRISLLSPSSPALVIRHERHDLVTEISLI